MGQIFSSCVYYICNTGAESVKFEGQALTVVGKVDPTNTKNKVDLVSPQPKKDNKVNKDNANNTKKKQPEKTDNDQKPKEAPLTTAVMKVAIDCEGCALKLTRVVKKTEATLAKKKENPPSTLKHKKLLSAKTTKRTRIRNR
ncbi:hypothetical protein Pyn_39241 [Prunus yedoensis var. nudiflora]|uniref:Heavy metal-associated isoprenylated plant protein 3-like n=1 Tax=Prunus yedoensis var. nudiflora TaxID=2094558 RepID=A0A314YPW0_PRUYE|nr:hypothetical protein Pyn_39241 [Prunus yedoensis var. nudiflora]